MRKLVPVISYLFHPLIMPTLGLLIILNSGTYLSLLDPAAKRAILFVLALGTLVFPLMMLPILYYRNLVSSYQDAGREERLIPQVIIREENSIAALEVMSRFAVDPRWLIYLPPTMSPAGSLTLNRSTRSFDKYSSRGAWEKFVSHR